MGRHGRSHGQATRSGTGRARGLTRLPPRRHVRPARRPDDRCREGAAPKRAMEESPGSTGIRCRLTAGGGDPRESATENKPPAKRNPRGLHLEPLGDDARRARVKRCGKSAPRLRQRRRQGKPHREQDRIGVAEVPGSSRTSGTFPSRHPGWSREARGNARPRGMVVPRPLQAFGSGVAADRTRLTGRLAVFFAARRERPFASRSDRNARFLHAPDGRSAGGIRTGGRRARTGIKLPEQNKNSAELIRHVLVRNSRRFLKPPEPTAAVA